MRILYFSRGYTPHDHRFLSAITEAGHEAVFLRLNPDSATETRRLPKGVKPVRGSLRTVISQVKPDLVHAGPLPDCGYQAAKSGFHPLVQMSWGSDILWEVKRIATSRSRVRFALQHADAVIGDCETVKHAAIKFGTPADRIVKFPWGVDLTQFKPAGKKGGIRAELGWQNNFVFLHLRAWDPLYDPLTVAKAFVDAARQNLDLRLLMPGNGSLSSELRKTFAQAGLRNRVHLPGKISYVDLPAYYRAADVYLSAAQSDGSSVSLLEALASGLPALVSDIPSNREWVETGKQGWLFPPKKPAVLRELILQATGSDKMTNMARQARKVAESRADWNRNKLALYKAYELAVRINR